ncbi:Glycerophosphodiester phosphodiesterase domain-containing protein 1 [Hondaea fermentalgiana]|uniref:Glycerophosphodiester phosphodiesterase domain-containing protein 1 n=1 Tax=Hondaea fermentalgiana TaxID=2315210 RepID=A0A2R5G3T2_9STRA|nr:Glycerophosphodiester phosphodiesterase domain-containing protein 1 [Hondaea fermentalgiana]|eukprot:GBG25696.1 Glycerophosphodiester phosphodiesterase domain-containing protein 1 [Hondaea fermentalgiana]
MAALLVTVPAAALLVYVCLLVAARIVAAKRRAFRLGKVCGHRGERESAPENTIAAFRNAARLLDGIELDVWLTKDERVVVLHDGSLDRMCGVQGHVHDFNYADLPRVLRRPSEGFPQGQIHAGALEHEQSEPIPLLEEVLDLISAPSCTTKIMIEFKGYSPALGKRVRALLEDRGLIVADRVTWFSLTKRTNQLIKEVDPRIPRAPSVADIVICVFAFHVGLLPLVPIDFDILALPCGSPEGLLDFCHRIPIIRSLPERFQLAAVTFFHNLKMSSAFFDAFRAQGFQLWLLGVNDEASFNLARRVGADTVFTDRPQWYTKMAGLSPA